MSINRVVLVGNVTRDGELREVGGSPVLEFGICVNDRRKNQQTGEWEDVPNFVDVTMWGRRAEAVAGHVTKGAKMGVEGRLRYRQWEAKDGTKRSKLEVVASELEFMSRRQERQQEDDFGWFE